MKTKLLAVALLVSAAWVAPVWAGGHHGGGSGGGGHFAAAGRGPARGGGGFYHSMPMRSFSRGPVAYSGRRYAPVGTRSPSFAYRQHYVNSYSGARMGTRHVTTGNFNRGNRVTRVSNRQTGARQVRHGNGLPSNWRNHVVAKRSANWHRDWNRHHDHWWHGHHCRFINGSWVIFDYGFYPWWPYWYPYDYYAYDYYPNPYGYGYGYGPGYYYNDYGAYQGGEYYDQNGYGSSDQSNDSTVAAAQEQLARQGYYNGEIDGILGPETRRAIEHYQSKHGLRVTGYLTADTLDALGLRQLASGE